MVDMLPGERREIEILEAAWALAKRAPRDERFMPLEWARIYRTAGEILEAAVRRRHGSAWHGTRTRTRRKA